jgi:hypothetical protein
MKTSDYRIRESIHWREHNFRSPTPRAWCQVCHHEKCPATGNGRATRLGAETDAAASRLQLVHGVSQQRRSEDVHCRCLQDLSMTRTGVPGFVFKPVVFRKSCPNGSDQARDADGEGVRSSELAWRSTWKGLIRCPPGRHFRCPAGGGFSTCDCLSRLIRFGRSSHRVGYGPKVSCCGEHRGGVPRGSHRSRGTRFGRTAEASSSQRPRPSGRVSS